MIDDIKIKQVIYRGPYLLIICHDHRSVQVLPFAHVQIFWGNELRRQGLIEQYQQEIPQYRDSLFIKIAGLSRGIGDIPTRIVIKLQRESADFKISNDPIIKESTVFAENNINILPI